MCRDVLLCLLLVVGGCGGPTAGSTRPPVPASGEFNAYVLATLATYPTDGTHGYYWPKDEPGAPAPWRGNARTLRYAGALLGEGDPQGRCHCSGLTFEVFLEAWMAWARASGRPERIRELDLEGVRRLQGQWFGSPQDRSTVRTALVDNGLGTRLDDLEQARPGDFVQLWRNDGSGHAAVFLAWERAADGTRAGVRYWSTQRSTKGIGERVERFGPGPHEVKTDEFYLCRVGQGIAVR